MTHADTTEVISGTGARPKRAQFAPPNRSKTLTPWFGAWHGRQLAGLLRPSPIGLPACPSHSTTVLLRSDLAAFLWVTDTAEDRTNSPTGNMGRIEGGTDRHGSIQTATGLKEYLISDRSG
jgi:hypothetical protein